MKQEEWTPEVVGPENHLFGGPHLEKKKTILGFRRSLGT